MNTSFVAFLNKEGIACASDTDMTLYTLSRQEPVGSCREFVFTHPLGCHHQHLSKKGEIAKHEVFGDYARDFCNYLCSVEVDPAWKKMTEDDRNIIFLGFGTDDVFPSVVDIMVHIDEETDKLVCDFNIERGIDHDNETDFFTLSHFEKTQPIMYGISHAAHLKLIDKQVEPYRSL